MDIKRSITERLRAAVEDVRYRPEAGAFGAAIAEGALPLESCVGYIRALAVIRGTLESVLRNPGTARAPALHRDNDVFRYHLVRDVPEAVDIALECAARIRLLSESNPAALPGVLFVLETPFSPDLTAALEKLFGLSRERGLSYIAGAPIAVFPDEGQVEEGDVRAMEQAARETATALERILDNLYPLHEHTLRYTITALNPDSGRHVVPQDRTVLEAVLRATDRVLAEYSYITLRFGLRGRRFTDSDGAWVLTLLAEGRDTLNAQVRWLISLLSARGVPSILLGRHLEILVEELEKKDAMPVSHLELLSETAQSIRHGLDRVKAAGQSSFITEKKREDPFSREVVELLACAVADDAAGFDGAIAAFLDYFRDARIFSLQWVDGMRSIADTFQSPAARER